DTSLAEYKDKNRRQNVYEGIIKTLNFEGIEIAELKQKINNFRSTYLQELKKIANSKRSGTSGDSIYKPSIVWFHMADSFLRPHVAQRKTQNNLVLKANEGNSEGAATTEWEESTDCDELTLDNSLPYEVQMELHNHLALLCHIEVKKNTEVAKCAREEHVFDTFGKSVAVQLKALPMCDALELQIESQTLISKKLIEKEERQLLVVTVLPQLNESGTYDTIYVPHI
ncbi:uncharacterized protein LOC118185791, partial [Stegodyphus dumicola]|uniref:uncharacterized protein LOC118185791 n=1 Tax=Stegodyphus dumicola TaxID=202533 RepID=UPI0015AB1CBD